MRRKSQGASGERVRNMAYNQMEFLLPRELSRKVAVAVEELSAATGAESRGAIFTRPEVVDFILDLDPGSSDPIQLALHA